MNNREKREHWQTMVKQWKNSGLSQSQFCKQSEIKLATLSYWKKRLSPNSTTSKPTVRASFIPVNTVSTFSPSEVTIQCGGLHLQVPTHALECVLPLLWKISQDHR